MIVKYFDIDNIPNIKDELSLCLGYFDGLHLGHLSLIEKAKVSSYKKALLTFEFKDDINIKNKSHLTSIEDKIDILNTMDIDYLFILSFDNKVKELSPSEFIEKIIISLNAKEIVVGEDYHFGKNKQGNKDTLITLSNDRYKVEVLPELIINDKKVGTSLIIEMIKNGDVKSARELLSRIYKITSIVKKGYNFGSKKNVPTANIDINGYIKPKNGVYATLIRIDDKILKGMTNVGVHPSINKLNEPIIETHIFDFDEDIYDKKIDIYFIDFIRDEIKFDDVDKLYEQLNKDKKSAEDILDNFLSSFSQMVPFVGIDKYIFGTDLEVFKNENLIDDVDVSLIGTSFELDYHLYQVKHDNIIFSFDKKTNKLVEMDIVNNQYGKLSNGIYVGLDKDELHNICKTLIRTDIEGVFISNDGYVVVTDEEKVTMILLFEKEVFKSLCFYFKEREKRDNDLLIRLSKLTKKYLNAPNKQIEDEIVSLYSFNLDITHKFVKNLKIHDIIKLGVVLNRLIHDNNYFEDYFSNENEVLIKIINYVNEKIENEKK